MPIFADLLDGVGFIFVGRLFYYHALLLITVTIAVQTIAISRVGIVLDSIQRAAEQPHGRMMQVGLQASGEACSKRILRSS